MSESDPEDVAGSSGLSRRQALRKAASVGAMVWAVPVINTVAATKAAAQEQGSLPSPEPPPAGGSVNTDHTDKTHHKGQIPPKHHKHHGHKHPTHKTGGGAGGTDTR